MKLNITFDRIDDGSYAIYAVVPRGHKDSQNPLLRHLEIREWSRGPDGLLFHCSGLEKPVDKSVWVHSFSRAPFSSFAAAKIDLMEQLRAAVGEFVVIETDRRENERHEERVELAIRLKH